MIVITPPAERYVNKDFDNEIHNNDIDSNTDTNDSEPQLQQIHHNQ